MKLDAISANVRYRNAWEGLDLGFVMARHWFLPLWGLWWITAAPVTLLFLALYWVFESTEWVIITVWWFKPLYEPMLLFWLSRRLFGEELSMREVLGAARKVLSPRLLANLTLFRFSPNRSFYMPVSHLEGLRREERRKRLRVLRGSQSAGAWLTIVGMHIEFALALGFLGLALFLTPEPFLPDSIFDAMGDSQHWLGWLNHLFWLFAYSLFAPFYVAGGFALYLTRRSQLEAWDLELAFRHMQPRFKGKGGKLSRSLLASLLAGILLLPLAHSSKADEPLDRKESKRVVTEVLDDEVFGTTEQRSYWRKLSSSEEPEEEDAESSSTDWIGALAEFLEYLAWTAVVIGVGLLIYYLSRLLDWLPEGKQRKESGNGKPSVLFGMPISPESLPEDIPAAIRQLLEAGHIRQALGLLYRATLARLVHEGQLRIPDSATEGECRTLVAASRPAPEADYFGSLTNLWIRCAYGHLEPQAEQILTLADTWQGLYRGNENG
jgi:hypothetical protein